jgi:DUF4097 and DUF4098 domain-containing protein YvlB/thiol-disulfide isomerase/thioredoxin
MRALIALVLFATTNVADVARTVRVRAGAHVEITLERADVVLRASTTDALLVTLSGPGAAAAALDVQGGGAAAAIVATGAANGRKVIVDIALPAGLTTVVRSAGRSIAVNGVNGSVSGSTRGGDIQVEHMRGALHMTTAGGHVAVRDSFVDGSVHTDGGGVLVSGVTGDLKATSAGGRVTIERSDVPMYVRADAGPIALDDAPRGGDLRTDAGDIEVRRAAGPLHLHTSAGNIRVARAAASVDAETMGGNAFVALAPSRAPRVVRVVAENGDVHLRVPAHFGMILRASITSRRRGGRTYRIDAPWPLRKTSSASWDTTTAGPQGRVDATAVTGDGRNRVQLATVDGDISIDVDGIVPVADHPSTRVGAPAPPLALTTWLKGPPVKRLARGRVYVIDIWAPWCGPCLGGMQHLTDLQKKYAARGLTVIGMTGPDDYGSTLTTAKNAVAQKGDVIGYTIAWDDSGANFKRWMEPYAGAGWPWAFIVDRSGRIAYAAHPEKMDAVLARIMGEGSGEALRGIAGVDTNALVAGLDIRCIRLITGVRADRHTTARRCSTTRSQARRRRCGGSSRLALLSFGILASRRPAIQQAVHCCGHTAEAAIG